MTRRLSLKWALITVVATLMLTVSAAVLAGEADPEAWLRDAAKPYKGTTIYVANHPNAYMTSLQPLVKEFEKITGIRVQLDIFGEPIALQKIGSELASGSGAYDAVWATSVDYLKYIRAGWVSPLDTFVSDPKLTNPKLLEKDDFMPSIMNAGVVDGKLYALPTFAATTIMYYRKDVFADLGIARAPVTFDELLDVVEKLAAAREKTGIAPIAMRGGRGQAINIWIWPTFLRGMGGNFFKDFPRDMHPVLDSKEAIAAAELYAKLLSPRYSIPGANVSNYEEVVRAFQDGKVAIIIDGAPLAGRIMDPKVSKVRGKTGFAVVPGGPAGTFPAFNAHGWMIPTASRNKEAAWLFIQWATWSRTQLRAAIEGTYASPTKDSVWNNPDFVKKYSFDGDPSFLKVTQKSLSIAPYDYRPAIPEWPEIGDIVGLALNKVTSGLDTAEHALGEANKEIREIMVKRGYIR